MRIKFFIVGYLSLLIGLAGCGAQATPTPDAIATQVAQAKAVAATLTASAPPLAPTATPIPAASTPAQVNAPTNTPTTAPPTSAPPTPTPIVIDDLPVDGENGNLTLRGDRDTKEGRYVLLPGFAHAEVTAPMVFRGRLALRVEVFDPQRGQRDGDGIQNVTFSIADNTTGAVVFQHTETSAPYCLFGGDDPLCTTLVFAQNGFQWPNGQIIFNGDYTAQRVIKPSYGENALWNFRFSIADAKERPTTTADLVVNLVQIGRGDTASTIDDALVFQVEAHNPAVGNNDGDGIDHVEMDIFGPNGKQLYHHTESTVHYCAFGGGEPNCNVFVFADNQYRWPDNGGRIRNGQHRLVAKVYAKDGRSQSIEIKITLQNIPG